MGSRKHCYEFLPHTADLKVRVAGNTVSEVFVNSVYALKEAICGRARVKPSTVRPIRVNGRDLEALLYAFLEEFLFLLDSEGFLPAEVRSVDIQGAVLRAEVAGDEAVRYKFSNRVKAITYNEMFVKEEGKKWVAEFVLDV